MTKMLATQTFRGNRAEGLVQRGDTFEANSRRARVLEERGNAVPAEGESGAEKQSRPEYTDKMQRPQTEDKDAPDRHWEGSGSWKTLYEDGDEVAKVQATKEEADKWASHLLSHEDIQ